MATLPPAKLTASSLASIDRIVRDQRSAAHRSSSSDTLAQAKGRATADYLGVRTIAHGPSQNELDGRMNWTTQYLHFCHRR
jgi:hypothetical protein